MPCFPRLINAGFPQGRWPLTKLTQPSTLEIGSGALRIVAGGQAMGLNDIVVYVDGTEAAKARVAFAVALAKPHGAHLIGIAFAPTTLLPLYGADVGFADMTEILESVKSQGANALDAFKARAAAEGLRCEARLMQGMSEEFPHAFAYGARHADLAILGQPRDGDPLIRQYALVERYLSPRGARLSSCLPHRTGWRSTALSPRHGTAVRKPRARSTTPWHSSSPLRAWCSWRVSPTRRVRLKPTT